MTTTINIVTGNSQDGSGWQSVFEAAFAYGTLQLQSSTSATLTLLNYGDGTSPPTLKDIIVTLTGTGLAVDGGQFTSGVFSAIDISLGGNPVATISFAGNQPTAADVNAAATTWSDGLIGSFLDAWNGVFGVDAIVAHGSAGNDSFIGAHDFNNTMDGGGSGNDTFLLGAHDDFVTAGAGQDVVVVEWNGGNDVVTGFDVASDFLVIGNGGIHSKNDLLAHIDAASSSTSTIIDLADGATLTLAGVDVADVETLSVSYSQTIAGTEAPETLAEDEGFDTFFARGGNDTINAGGGYNQIDGGGGDDLITVGGGHDAIFASHGHDTISGFQLSDRISVGLLGVSSMDQLQSQISSSGGNTVITFNSNDSLTLQGISPGALSDTNFDFSGRAGDSGDGGNSGGTGMITINLQHGQPEYDFNNLADYAFAHGGLSVSQDGTSATLAIHEDDGISQSGNVNVRDVTLEFTGTAIDVDTGVDRFTQGSFTTLTLKANGVVIGTVTWDPSDPGDYAAANAVLNAYANDPTNPDNFAAQSAAVTAFITPDDATVTGSADDDFVVAATTTVHETWVASHGYDQILGFDTATDKIDVSAFGITSWAEVQNHTYIDDDSNVALNFGDGDNLILVGVTDVGDLTEANFVIPSPPANAIMINLNDDAGHDWAGGGTRAYYDFQEVLRKAIVNGTLVTTDTEGSFTASNQGVSAGSRTESGITLQVTFEGTGITKGTGNTFATGVFSHIEVVAGGYTVLTLDYGTVAPPSVANVNNLIAVLQNGNSTSDQLYDAYALVAETGDTVITGTNNDDGTTGPSGLAGGSHNDTIYGLGGDDRIDGKDGNDVIDGGNGHNTLKGGNGDDVLSAGRGQQDGNYIQGSNFDGGNGNDTINGGAGDDYISLSSGNDVVHGGSQQDKIAANALDLNASQQDKTAHSTDKLTITLSGNTSGTITGFYGNGSNATPNINTVFDSVSQIQGSQGADTITASAGATATDDGRDFYLNDPAHPERNSQRFGYDVVGGNGADIFTDNSGQLNGVIVIDYDQEKWTHPAFNNLDHSNNANPYGGRADERGVIVNMSTASVTVAANKVTNVTSAATVAGVLASDTTHAGHALDTFGSTDIIRGVQAFQLTDAADFFTAAGATLGYSLNARGGNDTLIGGNGNDNFDGGAGNDSISTGAGSDWLGGRDGNDTLIGGAGDDDMNGGPGDDSFDGGAGHDDIY